MGQKISGPVILGANGPWGGKSVGRIVLGANFPSKIRPKFASVGANHPRAVKRAIHFWDKIRGENEFNIFANEAYPYLAL